MLIGSHLSIAGGMHNALLRAAGYGFRSVALFVRNQRQWRVPPLDRAAVRTFHAVREETGIGPVVAHGSYLVNLAGAPATRKQSVAATAADLRRCERLGIEYLVVHPGSHPDTATGIALIAAGLNAAVAAAGNTGPRILLETTAGQGNCIGHRFEHLAAILERLARPDRFGACLDTAHVFAAGYDIRTKAGWNRTMSAFENTVGVRQLRALHCNDTPCPLGSGKDRHAHLGAGRIGVAGFRAIVNDPRLRGRPCILETPKGTAPDGRDRDVINAAFLRDLDERTRRRAKIHLRTVFGCDTVAHHLYPSHYTKRRTPWLRKKQHAAPFSTRRG